MTNVKQFSIAFFLDKMDIPLVFSPPNLKNSAYLVGFAMPTLRLL
ncbi:hypothetical protein [Halothece sp. PCC 7418]|nr:hypothetical protein [Halothece sp. PCC 7418]